MNFLRCFNPDKRNVAYVTDIQINITKDMFPLVKCVGRYV